MLFSAAVLSFLDSDFYFSFRSTSCLGCVWTFTIRALASWVWSLLAHIYRVHGIQHQWDQRNPQSTLYLKRPSVRIRRWAFLCYHLFANILYWGVEAMVIRASGNRVTPYFPHHSLHILDQSYLDQCQMSIKLRSCLQYREVKFPTCLGQRCITWPAKPTEMIETSTEIGMTFNLIF